MKPSRIPRTALAVCALAAAAAAQVSPVNNTGCPGYAPPQWQGAPRLAQQIAFSLQRRPSPGSFVFLSIGYSSGGGIPFAPPLTCVPGPCVWYLAPFGNEYVLISDPFLATLALTIPNDRGLLFQTFAVQGGTFEGFGSCIALSQALSFAIGP
jgi:hypothetical protein